MKKLLIGGLLFFLSYLSSVAQATKADTMKMSLQQCIEFAMNNEITIKNAALDAEISHRQVQQTTGLIYPQISGDVNVTDYLKLPTSLIPAEFFGGEPGTFIPLQFGTQWNTTAEIQVSQLIADGRYFLGLKASRAFADLSKLEVGRTKIEIVEGVMKAYLTALISEQRDKQLETNITRFKKLYDDTKAFHEAGFVEKLDVDRIAVNYNNLLAEKDQTDKLSALSYYYLKFQMGMDVNKPIALSDSIREADFQADLQNAAQPDLNNRIEYQQLLTTKSLDEMNIKQYQYQYLPTIYGFGNLNYQAQREKFDFFNSGEWFPTWLIGLKLSVPIFDGFQKARQVQQARLTLEKNKNDALNFENSMNLQVSAAKTNLQNAISSLATQKSNLELAQEVVTISRKKFELGAGTSLEITDAEGSLKDAQTNYLSSLYDAWVAKIDLQKSLGTLYK